jgi:hypothetical protein
MRLGDPPTYVAIGSSLEVWLSTDGVGWRPGGSILGAPGGDVWWVRKVLVLHSTFVAFEAAATLSDGGFSGPYSGLNAGYTLTSPDGESWDRTPLDGFSVVSALVDGGEIVATGGLTKQYAPTFATSPDGTTWSLAPIQQSPWPAEVWSDFGALSGSRAAGFRLLVGPHRSAVNECEGAAAAPVPIAWRSADLESWLPATTSAPGCSLMKDLISGPAGDVAISSTWSSTTDTEDLRMWHLRDGVEWTEAAHPPDPLRWAGSLAIAPDGTFLEVGDGIWESPDGDRWFRSAPAKGLQVEAFAGDLAIACSTDACSALKLQ